MVALQARNKILTFHLLSVDRIVALQAPNRRCKLSDFIQPATTEKLNLETKSLAQTLDFVSEFTFYSHGLHNQTKAYIGYYFS